MKTWTRVAALVSVFLAASYCMAMPTTNSPTASSPKAVKIGKLVFEGGDGATQETAVVIKGAKNEQEGVDAERKWVNKVHPGWKKGAQALMNAEGKYYDRIEYTTPSGETQTIYFDITEFFGKF